MRYRLCLFLAGFLVLSIVGAVLFIHQNRTFSTGQAPGSSSRDSIPQHDAEVLGRSSQDGHSQSSVITNSSAATGTVTFVDSGQPAVGATVAAMVSTKSGYATMTRTDASGHYLLSVEPGSYYIRAWHKSCAVNTLPLVDIPFAFKSGHVISGVDFKLTPGVFIRGVVRDRTSSLPLPDATISYSSYLITHSSLTGEFELEGVPAGNIALKFNGAHHVARTVFVQAQPADCPFLDICLEKGGSVRGAVFSPEGIPVARAHIAIDYAGAPNETWSSDDGSFSLSGLPLDARGIALRASITGLHETYRELPTLTAAQAECVVEITLNQGLTLSGIVVDEAGRPVADAALYLDWREWAPVSHTGTHGMFALSGIPDSAEVLTARGSGYAPTSIELSTVGHEKLISLKLILKRGITVSGTVLSLEGHPLEGATICIDAQVQHAGPDLCTVSQTDGTFFLPDAPLDLDSLHFMKSGYCDQVVTITDNEHIVATLLRSGIISGRVVESSTDTPVRGFVVRVFPDTTQRSTIRPSQLPVNLGTHGLSVFSDDGYFAVKESLIAGAFYKICVSAPNHEDRMIDAVRAHSAEENATELVVELFRGQGIRGVVLDADSGSALDGVRVYYAPKGTASWTDVDSFAIDGHKCSVTSGDGTFALSGLNPNLGMLLLSKPGYARAVTPCSINNVLELQKEARLELHIVASDVSATSLISMSVMMGGERLEAHASDSQGTLVVSSLPAGDAIIEVHFVNSLISTQNVTLHAGETKVIDISLPCGTITGAADWFLLEKFGVARVRLWQAVGYGHRRCWAERREAIVTVERKQFHFGVLEEGNYCVAVHALNDESTVAWSELLNLGDDCAEIVVSHMTQANGISKVECVDSATGVRIGDAYINVGMIIDSDTVMPILSQIAPEGYIEFPSVVGAEYRIDVDASQCIHATREIVAFQNQEPQRITVERMSWLELEVPQIAGYHSKWVQVTCLLGDAGWNNNSVTVELGISSEREAGVARVNLKSGSYRLRVNLLDGLGTKLHPIAEWVVNVMVGQSEGSRVSLPMEETMRTNTTLPEPIEASSAEPIPVGPEAHPAQQW